MTDQTMNELDELDPAEVTRQNITHLIDSILVEWDGSEDELKFDQVVEFKSGAKLDGMKKRIAAGAFRSARQAGYIQPMVHTGDFPDKDQVTCDRFMRKRDESKYVATFFRPDFEAQCKLRDLDPKEVVEHSMVMMLNLDAYLEAVGTKRGRSDDLSYVGFFPPRVTQQS